MNEWRGRHLRPCPASGHKEARSMTQTDLVETG